MNEPPGPRSRGCLSGLTVAERFREAEGLWRMTLLVSIGLEYSLKTKALRCHWIGFTHQQKRSTGIYNWIWRVNGNEDLAWKDSMLFKYNPSFCNGISIFTLPSTNKP
ncbi:hypothetical protein NC653_027415 [Populus alba x Populus x berolinensis]|uniref:Uncharacterized protein n=1 Tax=Populus alba x Populus x berolinensis TaxID=444605 RepID=A0AAD6Q6U7_9ROSI|nr:hypothetical protein NC653_027415 [Populus alba x Populus x berolinensis]